MHAGDERDRLDQLALPLHVAEPCRSRRSSGVAVGEAELRGAGSRSPRAGRRRRRCGDLDAARVALALVRVARALGDRDESATRAVRSCCRDVWSSAATRGRKWFSMWRCEITGTPASAARETSEDVRRERACACAARRRAASAEAARAAARRPSWYVRADVAKRDLVALGRARRSTNGPPRGDTNSTSSPRARSASANAKRDELPAGDVSADHELRDLHARQTATSSVASAVASRSIAMPSSATSAIGGRSRERSGRAAHDRQPAPQAEHVEPAAACGGARSRSGAGRTARRSQNAAESSASKSSASSTRARGTGCPAARSSRPPAASRGRAVRRRAARARARPRSAPRPRRARRSRTSRRRRRSRRRTRARARRRRGTRRSAAA